MYLWFHQLPILEFSYYEFLGYFHLLKMKEFVLSSSLNCCFPPVGKLTRVKNIFDASVTDIQKNKINFL